MAVSRRRLLQLGLAPALLSRANAQVVDLAPTASRIYPGADGRLVYLADDQGNRIHDASHAGYRGGGVGIPTAPVRRRYPEMAKKFPLHPKHPERVCWGCDKYCPSDSLACGNGSERTQHPAELFGDDWHEWGIDSDAPTETEKETEQS